MQRECRQKMVRDLGMPYGSNGVVGIHWFLPAALLLAILTGCETTGQVRSMTDEDIRAATIIPPVVKEEQAPESVVEKPTDLPTLAESVTPSGTIQQEVIEPVLSEPSSEMVESSMAKPSPLVIPQIQESLESPSTARPEPLEPKSLQDVYFDFDQATILSSAKIILQANATLLRTHFQHLNILIEGHCDERGSVEYNLVLGVRRAQAVQAYLKDLGIPSSRIRIVSYGKERPVCTEQHEQCWQKNRRAHFLLR